MKCVMWVAFGLDLVGLGWLSGALGTFVSPRRTIKLFRARGQKRGFNLSELDWRYLQRFAALSNTQKKKKKKMKEYTHTHMSASFWGKPKTNLESIQFLSVGFFVPSLSTSRPAAFAIFYGAQIELLSVWAWRVGVLSICFS